VKEKIMNRKTIYLKWYLYLLGFSNIFLVSTLPVIFGDVFLWQPRNLPTEIMMASLYFAMGLVMVFAARKPEQHKAFVDFLVIANVLHAGVMLLTAQNTLQIFLDVIPIGVMGLLPLSIYPWGLKNFLFGDMSS
jgi:hypothetical protein